MENISNRETGYVVDKNILYYIHNNSITLKVL